MKQGGAYMTDNLIQFDDNGKPIKWQENPFIDGFRLMTKTKKSIIGGMDMEITDRKTGEVTDKVPHIVKVTEYDTEEYVKTFTRMIKSIFELNGAGSKVHQLLFSVADLIITGRYV